VSLASRLQSLGRLREGLVSHEGPLLSALHADLRKPPHEAYAAEIGLVLAEIDHALKHLKGWMRATRRGVPWIIWPSRAQTVHRPLGVSLIMGPWNYPVQLSILPLVGAIAGGNCAVIKPSELTPHTSEAIASMIGQVFSSEHIACVQGDRFVAEALLNQRFEKIFFTGSTSVGRSVATAAAQHLTPVSLELGGKCPVIVCDDANIRIAARRIVWAKTMNSGQTCVAPDYLLVQSGARAALIEAIKAEIKRVFGDDVQKSPHYSRIVNQRHFERLLTCLKQGMIVAGGENDSSDLFIAPTVLENVPLDSQVMQDEIFGPILPVLTFDKLPEALAIVLARPSPLGAYIFTANRSTFHELQNEIRAGAICHNDLIVQLFGKDLPFGGVGDSGIGRYHGKASFDCFTYVQTQVECPTAIDLPFRYAPPMLTLRRYKKALGWVLRG
jgi:acyl-CoA reductase-like NAD-dependent aldehyde dehydrogenase